MNNDTNIFAYSEKNRGLMLISFLSCVTAVHSRTKALQMDVHTHWLTDRHVGRRLLFM